MRSGVSIDEIDEIQWPGGGASDGDVRVVTPPPAYNGALSEFLPLKMDYFHLSEK